jgi:peptidoglycan hydrolase CwlO-like protein
MTPIQIAIPESLISQKAELETTLAGIASEEEKLVAQRKDIQVALESITTAVAVLSGQPLSASNVASPTGRKPMSPEARQRIAEGLRKSAQAKALAKAALGAAPAPQEPAEAPADAPVPIRSRASRKGARV